jgi:hypothetical protein
VLDDLRLFLNNQLGVIAGLGKYLQSARAKLQRMCSAA